MKAVVMAGGMGSRLRPLTAQLPKPLVPVAGRPVMEHMLNLLRRHGVTEVMATVHYRADMIQRYFGDGSAFGMRMRYVREEHPLGTAGAVKQAHDFLRGEPFLVISGDALTDMDLTALVNDHRRRQADATIALKHASTALAFGIAVTDDERHITRFVEKPSWGSVFSDTINTGVYVLEPSVLDMMEHGKTYDFSHEIFPRMLEEGKTLLGHITEAYWADIGTVEQYRQSCFDALTGAVDVRIPGKRIRAGVYAAESARIHPTASLQGPIMLGRNVRIGANARIEGPVILGNGSVVGTGACLTGTIAWDRVRVGEGASVEGGILADGNTVTPYASISSCAVRGPVEAAAAVA